MLVRTKGEKTEGITAANACFVKSYKRKQMLQCETKIKKKQELTMTGIFQQGLDTRYIH